MNETKTIRKFFWVWEFDKEEMWLNEMAASGWVLERVGFLTYHFSPCEPGEYALRLEMRAHDDGYVRFLEETGAEYVGRMFAWMYTRKKTADGPFDLFSDMDSRIGHLNRIGKVLFIIAMINLLIGCVNLVSPSRVGIINLLCGALLLYALGRIHGKKEALEKERLLHE